ncbi:zinc-binding dehydrogenase [Rhodococcus indonesiensis]|uniref:zinc-binding dehydrogenase n=1 Tax=Rhodococcus indonesiensis TaxID=3055869 RepID=UPI0039F6CA73
MRVERQRLMRAVVMQDGRLRVEEIAEPVPGSGEVLVEVLACGICGSDKSCLVHGDGFNRAALGAFGTPMLDLSKPIVFGHEFVAEIVSYGPDTERKLPPGTRVVSMPILMREQPVLLGFGGTDTPGAYAQRMVLSEALLIPVPDQMSTDVAALTEPLAVALRSLNRAETAVGDVPLVLGCGPIGLAVIVLLKARGVGPIVAADLSPERRAFALKLGADVAVDPTVDSPYQAWMQAAATDDPALMSPPTAVAGRLPLRPTVGFECTGAPGLLQQMISGAPPGSRIAVAGINFGSDTVEPAQAIVKELDLRFCLYYSPEEFARTLELLASGDIDPTPLITGRVGLDDVADAFERLDTSPTDAKILIDASL